MKRNSKKISIRMSRDKSNRNIKPNRNKKHTNCVGEKKMDDTQIKQNRKKVHVFLNKDDNQTKRCNKFNST